MNRRIFLMSSGALGMLPSSSFLFADEPKKPLYRIVSKRYYNDGRIVTNYLRTLPSSNMRFWGGENSDFGNIKTGWSEEKIYNWKKGLHTFHEAMQAFRRVCISNRTGKDFSKNTITGEHRVHSLTIPKEMNLETFNGLPRLNLKWNFIYPVQEIFIERYK